LKQSRDRPAFNSIEDAKWDEAESVESREATVGAEPDVAVASLSKCSDGALG